MRQFLYILGAVFLGIIVIGAAVAGYGTYRSRASDRESKAFVDTAIPAIAANWDDAELLKRAAPELLAKTPPDQIHSLFEDFARLGPLVKYNGSKGGNTFFSWTSGAGETISAEYIATARCQNANVTFKIAVLKRNGHWQITNLYVDLNSATPADQRQTAT